MHWSDHHTDMAEWHDQIGLTSEFTQASALTALPMHPERGDRRPSFLAAEPAFHQKP